MRVKYHTSMDEPTPAAGIEHLREYFLSFGSVGHYLKRAQEWHASKKTSDPLPPRWLHLAERSLLRADYPRYGEFAANVEASKRASFEPARLARLDALVGELNAFLKQSDILAAFRKDGSPELRKLSELYKDLRHTLYGVKSDVEPTE